jgi:pimeloyl-ACP methyl ester carboxylesterase
MRPTSLAHVCLAALLCASVGLPAAAESPALATGSDLEKEARWREQVVDGLMDGEAVDLVAGEQTFLGLYTQAEGGAGEPSRRGVLIVHGIGVHPDWPQVVHPLRVGLPAQGWSTLSIQMPILGNEADSSDYLPLMDAVAPRMDAAIAFLKGHGAERVVVIAHSLGATMSGDYLAGHPGAADAFVAIGMSGGAAEARLDNVQTVGRIKLPVLDLYGENDLPAVVETASRRAQAAQGAGNGGYHQIQVPDADHFFDGQDDALLEVIDQWLDETLPTD